METNEQNQQQNTQCSMNQAAKVKRTRAETKVVVPEGQFTFSYLREKNKASPSSLRKAMKLLVSNGTLVVVSTLKGSSGRPQYVYKRA